MYHLYCHTVYMGSYPSYQAAVEAAETMGVSNFDIQ